MKPALLIVDDDVDTCRNLSDILTDLGYRVDTAHEGLTALELVRRSAYDVALLDYKMPGMDGLTLYREIKRLRAGTVAIVVTAVVIAATGVVIAVAAAVDTVETSSGAANRAATTASVSLARASTVAVRSTPA